MAASGSFAAAADAHRIADVDATATAAPEASLTIVSGFADTTIRVPAGPRVRHRGLSILGDRHLQMATGAGVRLTLTGYGIFSDVEMIEAPRSGLDVDKDDVKRSGEFIHAKLYDRLAMADATAKANRREYIQPWDLPITRGCRSASTSS